MSQYRVTYGDCSAALVSMMSSIRDSICNYMQASPCWLNIIDELAIFFKLTESSGFRYR